LLNYSYTEQLKDLMPTLLISLGMGAIVYMLNFLNLTPWQLLILQILTGAILYLGFSKIFRVESLNYLIATMREMARIKPGIILK
jgi:teichuronic acid exporter